MTTPEDLIIAKLEWTKAGGSSRHVEDVASILRVNAGKLDLEYFERWVRRISLDAEWQLTNRDARVRVPETPALQARSDTLSHARVSHCAKRAYASRRMKE